MRLLLFLAAATRLTAASYLRDAAPRSAGGLLFLNTTGATLSTSTESVSPTKVDIISSAAGGNPTMQPTTSQIPTTPPVRLGSSRTTVMAPISPGDLTIAGTSLSSGTSSMSSTPAVEPIISDPVTVVRSSPGVSSSPAAAPASSDGSTIVHSSSNPGSNPAVEPTSPDGVPITQGRLGLSSAHAAEPTTLTTVRGSPGPGSDPARHPATVGDFTTVPASPSSSSTDAGKPTASTGLTAEQPASSLSSKSVAKPASTGATTAFYGPTSVYSESEDEAGPASTTTHAPEPSRSTTSAEIASTLSTEPSTAYQSSSVYSASPTTLGRTTSGAPSNTWTLTLAGALSRTAHGTATQDIASPSRQDRASASVSTSPPPWTATTASPPATAPKPQMAMHAAAIDANTTVEGSLLTVTPPTPPPAGTRADVAENLTTAGAAVTSQAVQGSSSTSRTSTASIVTLSGGGATPTTILTEAGSPTGGGPSGPVATPSQGLPRVILPNSSGSSLTNGRLIQLGFLFPLNYVFVSQHLQAAAQIFEVLPGALAHGTVQRSGIEVARLVPYDTQATVGYITTVAKLYYPKASVDQLQRDILDPKSDIYTRGGDMQRNLTALIDPAIKITDDSGGMDCASQPCDASPSTSSSSKQTGITAGAVVGGATVCGALGLGIFQLYRRRGSAPAWPFGKQKNRLTGSRISRPIDSVNSLGWNWLTDK